MARINGSKKNETSPMSSRPFGAPAKAPSSPPSARPALSPAAELRSSTMSTATATAPRPTLTHQEIADRAKAIWKKRGCLPAQDEANWLEAERQLRKEKGLAQG